MLKTKGLTIYFGGLAAVSDLDIELNEGELVGLIGPNGAGKTTVYNLLTGVYAPTKGEIILNGVNIAGLKPYQITSMGIARTFQNIRLFDSLSVIDNVKVAAHWHKQYPLINAILRLKGYYQGEEQITQEALKYLEVFNLVDKKDELAKNLPYGEQRRLEIVRALAAKPKLLLLDEPAAGMNPQETQALMELIRQIREQFGLTILLIEHDMSLVMGICERIYVLDYGKLIAHGTPEEIKNNPRVIEAYLGEEA